MFSFLHGSVNEGEDVNHTMSGLTDATNDRGVEMSDGRWLNSHIVKTVSLLYF